MPQPIPADMARQLLYLAGDKVDFDPWKRKLLEGGWMPRGGSGRSAQGEVVQMPTRPGREPFADWIQTGPGSYRSPGKGPLTDAEKFQAALQAQRSQNTPSFNPQMTNPYPSKPMAQSYQERQPIQFPNTGTLKEMGIRGYTPSGKFNAKGQEIPQEWLPSLKPSSAKDTAQTSFPRAQEMMVLRDKMEMARWGRLLSEQERATLNRPGWESPQ